MKYDQSMVNRMKRVEGQIRGIQKMMDEEQNCKDIITQLTAVRSAIDRTIGIIVSENLVECISKSDEEDTQKLIQEAVNLLVKSR